MRHPGFSVIEVIVALGMGVIVITVVGNLVSATNRLTSSSGKEVQATAYAKQWLEILSSQANQSFGCSCGATNPCAGNICNSGGQSCDPRTSAGFNSCWLPNPIIGTCSAPNMFKWNASAFALGCDNPTTATTDTDFHPDYVAGQGYSFTRTMAIENLARDGSDNLTGATGCTGSDCNTKRITVTVAWTDSVGTRQVKLTTVLTAWKNF